MGPIRVCFVGDSVTLGTGDERAQGWPGRLCDMEFDVHKNDISCYNLGIRAETSQQIRARWMQECELRLPEHIQGRVIFLFCLNYKAHYNRDNNRVPLEESKKNAHAMMSSAKSWKPTLWLGPTPIRNDNPIINPGKSVVFTFNAERTAILNDAYREIAAELKIPYFDMHNVFQGTKAWKKVLNEGDGVHPTGDGYQLIAESLIKWDAWRHWLA